MALISIKARTTYVLVIYVLVIYVLVIYVLSFLSASPASLMSLGSFHNGSAIFLASIPIEVSHLQLSISVLADLSA